MAQLQPGDVLLFRGRGFVSRAIRLLDGSEVNHAAIALTDRQFAEATAHGLDVALIDVAVERADFITVSRAPGTDPAPAVAQARAYLGEGVPYGYHQILLLAGLCLTRRVPLGNPLFRRVVRRTLDAAAELLASFVDRGTDLMICSEYVYRCYRAGGLDLLPTGIPDAAGAAAADGVVLLDWLEGREAPGVSLPPGELPGLTGGPSVPVRTAGTAVPFAGPVDPATIAEHAEYELDELIAEYVASERSPGGGLAAGAAADAVPDEDLLAAAGRLAAAAERVVALRSGNGTGPGGGAQPGALVGGADVVRALSGVFSTNANFVTPKDLALTSALEQVEKLTPS